MWAVGLALLLLKYPHSKKGLLIMVAKVNFIEQLVMKENRFAISSLAILRWG